MTMSIGCRPSNFQRYSFVLVLLLVIGLALLPSTKAGAAAARPSTTMPATPYVSGLAHPPWSANTIIENGGLVSVSCPSDSFCMAGGNANPGGGAAALIFDGSSWSSQTAYRDTQSVDGLDLLNVSCQKDHFCIGSLSDFGAKADGKLVVFSGQSWSKPLSLPLGKVSATACAPTSLCMVSDGSRVLSYLSGRWSSTPTTIAASTGIHGVLAMSCPTKSFCAEVDGTGRARIYTDGRWSHPRRISADSFGPNTGIVMDVACASSAFCLAVDGKRDTMVYRHGGWSKIGGQYSFKAGVIQAISCPTSLFCIGVDDEGNALTFNGRAWGLPKKIDEYKATGPGPSGGDLRSVSCASADLCVAVGTRGQAIVRR